jgi:hypothetical protein
MSASVFEEHYLDYCLAPWDVERLDFLIGELMAVLANINRDQEKKRSPFKRSDFIPDWYAEDETAVEGKREDRLQRDLGMLYQWATGMKQAQDGGRLKTKPRGK